MQKQRSRKLLSLSAYLGIGLVVYFIITSHPDTLAIGAQAPLDESVILLSGEQVSLQSLKTPLLINVWASWCPSCVQKLPLLSKLHERFKSSITFVGLALDSPPSEVETYKKRFLLDYPLALISKTTARRWHATTVPTIYLIDKDGRVRFARVGSFGEDELEQAINALSD